MRRLALVLAIGLVAVAAYATWRAVRIESRQVAPGTPAAVTINTVEAGNRLGGALQLRTVSWGDVSRRDTAAFLGFHDYLRDQFPRVTGTLTREVVADYSLLYTWPGSQPNLTPIILTSHQDVVPAEVDAARWQHPPFSGFVDGAAVWGRGALDDKSGVLGLLEAVSALLETGFTPTRTIYLAFGHNEEGDGATSGAAAIADLLRSRGVHDAWLLDEGGVIYDKLAGVARPVALVGISEKGIFTISLSVEAAGGHSSMPPAETAIGILSAAVDRVERHPMPARFDGVVSQTFATLAPEMTWPMRTAFANLWLTRPLIVRRLTSQRETNALVRTTTAPTVLAAGEKSNVLATSARAVINFRLLPGDTAGDVIAHVTRVVADPRVKVATTDDPQTEPARVASTDTAEFQALARSIRAVYPDAIVAPFLTVAATDARAYRDVAANSYRFLPVYQPGAIELFHGIDEHIRLDVYERAIRFYATLMQAMK